jgi:CheY-like chemotaxis protein
MHDGNAHGATRLRPRVLIIDDELLLIRSFGRILGRDYEVTAVPSAREALDLIPSREWDVILCDLHMPDLDGVEFHHRLRRSYPELMRRLAFVTGGAFTPRAESFLRSVTLPVLWKPVTPDDLRAFVEEVARSVDAAGLTAPP